MNAIILPYKNGSRSGAALANALGVRQIRLAGSTIQRQRPKKIINWGNSGRNLPPQGLGSQHTVINSLTAVAAAANKLNTFNLLYSAYVRIPEYTTEYETAYNWMDEDSNVRVVERHQLTGHSGAGIVIAEAIDALSDSAHLYVKYVKKQDEYRVHIMAGEVIDVQRKARRSDVPDEEVNWQVRNRQNGFCYMRENVNPDADVIEQSLNAIEALGLDFGAVDVIWNAHQGKAYVLEVNTACGLEGTTLERYKVAFQELLSSGEVTPLEGYDFSEEESVDIGEDSLESLTEEVETLDAAFASDETYALDAGEDTQSASESNPEFLLGNRVVVTRALYTSHRLGDVGVVETVRSHGCHVRINGTCLFYPNSAIELAPRTLQTGDRVRIARSSQYYGTSLDSSNPSDIAGTVIEERSLGSSLSVIVEWDNGTRNVYNVHDLELFEDGVVQEEQEVVQEEQGGPLDGAVEVRFEDRRAGDFVVFSAPFFSFGAGSIGILADTPDLRKVNHFGHTVENPHDRTVRYQCLHSEQRRNGSARYYRPASANTSTQQTVDTPEQPRLNKWLVSVDGSVNLEEGVFDTQEEAEMAITSPDFHNMRQLGHDVRVVSL